ncbi:MAG: hypothetical protein GXC75_00860 [Xanthomonadaceae bacterium]|nr:hypothetical protein [Xanthomonadaceae bacterium]
MNPAHDDGHDVDRQARRLHQDALAQVSPQTLMRLRGARHEAGLQASPGRGRTWRWLTATAFSAVLAVGIGLQWLPRTPAVPASTPVAAAVPSDGDAIADELGVAGTFDEDPDLYLWLASAEAQPLAMESTR